GRVRDMQGFLVQPGQEFFASVYLGCSTIVMAAAACSCRSQPMARLLLVLAFLGVWLSIGEKGGAWCWTQAVLPPLAFVRYPVKALILTMAAASLLTAFALKEIASGEDGVRGRSLRWLLIWCCIVGTAITGATFAAQNRSAPGLAENRSAWMNLVVRLIFLGGFITGAALATGAQRRILRLIASPGTVVLLWIDFSTHMPGLNPVLPSGLLAPGYARPNSAPHFGSGRVFISPEAEAALLESHVRSPEADYVGKRLALWSNLNLLEDVPKVNGAATLRVREQDQVEVLLYGRERIKAESADKLMNFLGVTHQTSQTNVTEWAERTNALPLITAGQEPVFVDGDAVLDMLRSGNVDLAQKVLLPEQARAEAAATGATNLSRLAAKIISVKLSANRIEFEVESEAPVWVVIAQTYDHNWRAWVNEERAVLWRANHAFQSLAVAEGVSRVVLRYKPVSLRIGMAISSGTFMLVLAMTVRGVLLRRGESAGQKF
ncbi:MAG: YfhO family protein, partial [Verrucomicrobiia bacterium]